MRISLVTGGAIAAALLVLGAVALTHAGAQPTLQQVTEGLTCQCGCGLTVANCNHPNCSFSVPLRGEIGGMLKKGMTADQILLAFRHKYGEKILSAPTTEGFNILAWVMPFAALTAGALLVIFAVVRWNRSPGDSAPVAHPAPARDEFDQRLRSRLERQLREGL